ncbi:hypothetical protein M0R45_018414 [Rubus argutus]|uniref:Uncharacterized protein n=1 Tax=Rubus argutus TaxID=59490 RepID=A0AAW1X3S9_RUBAR
MSALPFTISYPYVSCAMHVDRLITLRLYTRDKGAACGIPFPSFLSISSLIFFSLCFLLPGKLISIRLSLQTTTASAASTTFEGNRSIDPLTELNLATPGTGGCSGSIMSLKQHHHRSSNESFPALFWDVMRGVIAREVRDYVSSSFSEKSGLQ